LADLCASQDDYQDEDNDYGEEEKPNKPSPPKGGKGTGSVPAGREQSSSKQASKTKESPHSAVGRSDKKGRDSDHRHSGKRDAKEFDEFNDEEDYDDDAFDLYGDLDDNYGKSGRSNTNPAKDEFSADDSSYRKSSGHTSRGSTSTAAKEKSKQRKGDVARYIFFM
jgi:hypothetical protein